MAPKVDVKWITWKTPPTNDFGHGVVFYDVGIDGRRDSLVAFLDGFAWLHGLSNEAVIYCIRPNRITTAKVLRAMSVRIEDLLERKTVPNDRITARIKAVVHG